MGASDKWRTLRTCMRVVTDSEGVMVTTNRPPPSSVQNQNRVNNGRDPSCPDQREGPQRARVDDDVMPYSVKKGDTLTEIARAHDTTVDELLELNPALKANPSKLSVGQDIDVPAADRIENKPQRQQASADTQRSSRERAMAGETAARARVLGPYGTPAPSMEDIRGEGARMRRGMSGESVKEMQRKLNALGANPPLEVDGKFGPKTERALEEFQGDHGVQQTGVLGATTLEALDKAKPRPASERTGSSSGTGTGGTQRSGRTVDVGDIQGGTKAQRLAQIAERTATRMGTVGKCALGVNNSLIAAGLSSERGHAYQKAEQLARDSDFREVNVSRDQLARLPAGAVVVWGRSAAKPWGHVTVSLGDGREASDHVQRMITGGRYGTDFGRGPDPQGRQFRVFMPVG